MSTFKTCFIECSSEEQKFCLNITAKIIFNHNNIVFLTHHIHTHTHTGAQKGWGVRGKSKKTEFEVTCGGVFAEVIFIIF